MGTVGLLVGALVGTFLGGVVGEAVVGIVVGIHVIPASVGDLVTQWQIHPPLMDELSHGADPPGLYE